MTSLDDIQRIFAETNNSKTKIQILLEFAVRAPSTHNTQPWKFKIKDFELEVYADQAYSLKEADPKGRDMMISLGACIENIVIGAKYFNYFHEVKYTGDRDHVATIRFKDSKPSGETDTTMKSLATSILNWKNSRGEFDLPYIPFDFSTIDISEFTSHDITYCITQDKEKITKIALLTGGGVETAHANPKFRSEMSKWMNTSISRKKDGIPGYALRMPFILSFIVPTVISWLNMGPVLSKKTREALDSAPCVVTIHSKTEDPLHWLIAGRVSERVMLSLQSTGLNTSIYVGAIEMPDVNSELRKLFDRQNAPQFLFAVGKMKYSPKKSPRRPVVDSII